MARSYWGAYSPPFGKHPGIEIDDYCVPPDACFVKCDMRDFTCKDMPSIGAKENDILHKEPVVCEQEGDLIRLVDIVPFLKFLKSHRREYFPPEGSPKWNFFPYETLRFYRVDKEQFYITGRRFLFPLNWKMIMQDKRYGEIHSA